VTRGGLCRFDDLPELVFTRPRSFLGALELFNIKIHTEPIQPGPSMPGSGSARRGTT